MSMSSELRPMTDAERREATRLLGRKAPSWSGLAIMGCAAIMKVTLAGVPVAIAAFAILEKLHVYLSRWWLVQAIGTLVVLGAALGAWIGWRSVREHGPNDQERGDLEEGYVEVVAIEAQEIFRPIAIERYGPPGFFADLGGELLSLKGEYLEKLVLDGRFPCRRFRLVRLPASKLTISLEPQGEPVEARVLERPLGEVADGTIVKP